MKKPLVMIGAAVVCLALGAYADGTTLTWNGAAGASWEGANWLEDDGETPSAWVDGANAVFPAAATVSLSGQVVVSNLTTSAALTITGTVASVHSGFLNGTSAVLVFPGLTLDDIDGRPIAADLNGSYMSPGDYFYSRAYIWRRSGNTATAQFQAAYNGHLRCVKATFTEGADGIYAKASAKSYLLRSTYSGASKLGTDIDELENVETLALATTADGSGVGVCNVRRYDEEVQLTGTATLGGTVTLTQASLLVTAPQAAVISQWIQGAGSLVVKGLSAPAETTYGLTGSESSTAAAWLTPSGNTLSNVMLSQMVPVSAVMRGSSIGVDNTCQPYHVKSDGQTMTLQFQFAAGSGNKAYIKGCKVEFTQNVAADVTAKWVEAYYHVGGTLGEDMETASGVTKYSKASDYTGNGLKNMTLRQSSAPALVCEAGMVRGANVLIDNAQAVFTGSNRYSPAENMLARNGAQVMLLATGGASAGTGHVRRFESGSSLVVTGNIASETDAHYIFDASILYTPTKHETWLDGRNYFDFLTLRNGAQTIGYPLRCGNRSAMTYRSEGTGTNRIESGICLYHNRSSTLSIEADADLEIQGNIYNPPSGRSPNVVKRGTATLTLSGNNTFAGRFTVEAGTVALGSNTALPASAPLTLAGGTVTCGSTTNATGVLTLAGNATIDVGDGALSFADSHAATWAAGATLNITGNGRLPTRSIRFGTSEGGLTAAQREQIRYNGSKVSLSAEGYLASPKGLIISFF